MAKWNNESYLYNLKLKRKEYLLSYKSHGPKKTSTFLLGMMKNTETYINTRYEHQKRKLSNFAYMMLTILQNNPSLHTSIHVYTVTKYA